MGYAVKYSTSNVDNTFRKGNVALGVSSEGYEDTATSGLYSGVAPVAGKHNLVVTSATGDPDFYCVDDSELVLLAQNLGGSVGTSLEAKNYLNSRSDTVFTEDFISSNIITDGLVLNLDARNKSSFLDNIPTINLHPDPYINSHNTSTTRITDYGWFTEISTLNDDIAWYGAYKAVPVVSGSRYRMSYYYKWIAGSTKVGGHQDNPISGQIRVDGGSWVGGNIYSGFPTDGEFHLVELEWTSTYTGNVNLWLQPGRSDTTLTTGHYLTGNGYGIQVEEGTTTTPFVSGSRSQNTTWYDLSGNNNSGSLVNGPTFNSKGYLEFDGTNDYCAVPNQSFNSSGDSSFTIEIVFKRNNSTPVNADSLYEIGTGGSTDVRIYFWFDNNSNGQMALNYYAGPGYDRYITLSSQTLDTNFHHAVQIVDKSINQMIGYWDGVNKGSGSILAGSYTSDTIFNICGINYCDASVAFIKIYNRALSAAEVQSNYRHYKKRFNI